MKEHGLLFNTAVVEAILDGRQTQDRRPMKPQPYIVRHAKQIYGPTAPHSLYTWKHMETGNYDAFIRHLTEHSPYGKPGDIIWVREKFAIECPYGPEKECDHQHHVMYWAGESQIVRDSVTAPWHPSIHMPRWACRLELKVLRTWPQPILDMVGSEFLAEAAPERLGSQRWFLEFWDSIYGRTEYRSGVNPWVWACEFPRQEFT